MTPLDASLQRLRTLHPMLIDLSLGRIAGLLHKLGAPHRHLPPVVHVAGTNGKGSTVAFLKAIMQAAGLRVHVYTSPHLVRFSERISVAGPDRVSRPIADEALLDVLGRVERANAGDPMTFFEITTAAAFLAFAEIPADVVIVEVGLGGEFDATNVLERPQLCVITPVDVDHADKLGATIPLIAKAKAGIIKADVPVVVSLQRPEALDVIRAKARDMRAPLFMWGEDFDAYLQNGRLICQSEDEVMDLPPPGLIGPHQIVNAGTSVAAAQYLRPLGIDDAAIAHGLTSVEWPARMQRITSGRLRDLLPAEAELWLDGGHNPHGAVAIAQTLADLDERSAKPLFLVVGMQSHKDAAGFLSAFKGLAKSVLAVPIPAMSPPQDASPLVAAATSAGLDARRSSSIDVALREVARLTGNTPSRVLICGSLWLAGHVLAAASGAEVQAN
jgi:dihydrofolate synthase/folylpolyglutamate synthase